MRRLIDMKCASEYAGGAGILAYGTSEGVQKSWDVRVRKTLPDKKSRNTEVIHQQLTNKGWKLSGRSGEGMDRHHVSVYKHPDFPDHRVEVQQDGKFRLTLLNHAPSPRSFDWKNQHMKEG